MDSVRNQFASNLRHHRDEAGLSQEELAEICELHRTEISLLERSKRSPRLETIVILAQGLKLDSPGSCWPASPEDPSQADAGTRTPDPLLTMEVLYQLSYVGTKAES